MDITRINQIEEFQSLNSSIELMGYSKAGNKVGLVPLSSIIGKNSYCGVRFRKGNASPEGEPFGDLEMLANLNNVLGLGGYLVKNDHSRRKLATDNHFKFAAGGTAALDGSMGHYQWGWNVPWYYAHWEDDTFEYEAVSTAPIPGRWNYKVPVASMSASGAATLDRTNNILVSYCNRSAQYRGGQNDASFDGKWNTQCGKPVVNVNAELLQQYAEKNGGRWGASMSMMVFCLGVLCRIVFHNRNIQAGFRSDLTADGLHQGGLGGGVDDAHSLFADSFATIDMDALAEHGDALGVFNVTYNKGDGTYQNINNVPCFFGLKNFYHYLWMMMHGVVITYNADKSIDVHALSKWTNEAVSTGSTNGLTKIGTVPAVDTANWYWPTKMNLDNMCLYPLAFGGSENTYYCDGFYHPAWTSGLLGLAGLGTANVGGLAGVGYLDGRNAPSLAWADRGAFLCEADEDWDTTATWVS